MCTYYMQCITTNITYGHRFSKIVKGGTTLYRTCCIENRFTRVFPMILQYLVLINLTSSYLCLAIIHCPKKAFVIRRWFKSYFKRKISGSYHLCILKTLAFCSLFFKSEKFQTHKKFDLASCIHYAIF